MSPRPRMQGAYLAGRVFTQIIEGAHKYNIDDPRGINPPFGKTFSLMPRPGDMILHPGWTSYTVTPNMKKEPTVCFPFLIYPADKHARRYFNDDLTSNMIV